MDNLANELWIIILIFVYKLFDRVYGPADHNFAQKSLFLRRRYEDLDRQFGDAIRGQVSNEKLQPLIFSVLIYETFNRPTIIRWIERQILFPLGLAKSIGPMQVQTDELLSDPESVRLGVSQLADSYNSREAEQLKQWRKVYGESAEEKLQHHQTMIHRDAVRYAASTFNIRSDYAEEVLSIHDFVIDHCYPQLAPETVGLG